MRDEVTPELRRQLAELACRPRSRSVGRPPATPSDWRPFTVANVESISGTYTDQSAWELIAALLTRGEPVYCIKLEKPPGRTGFVMKPRMPGGKTLYIKLQLGSGTVIGRSFHYSYETDDK